MSEYRLWTPIEVVNREGDGWRVRFTKTHLWVDEMQDGEAVVEKEPDDDEPMVYLRVERAAVRALGTALLAAADRMEEAAAKDAREEVKP